MHRIAIRHAPNPAARVGQLLRLGKMTFTPAQGILDSFPFGYSMVVPTTSTIWPEVSITGCAMV
jgi:hypothetical protein